LSKNNALQAYSRLGSVNSDVVVRCINDFCKDLDKKTVLVMDNSPIHTSETFQDHIPAWEEKGLDIFYLPKYSPALNCIEILWRFIKYEWIELDAYKSWTHLVNYVENVLQNFGYSPGSTLKKKKGQTSDQCGAHHHSIGGLTHAKTSGLGPTVSQPGLFSLSADQPWQR
jgi:hypothetical protein